MGKGYILFTEQVCFELSQQRELSSMCCSPKSSSKGPFVNRYVGDLAHYVNQSAKYMPGVLTRVNL